MKALLEPHEVILVITFRFLSPIQASQQHHMSREVGFACSHGTHPFQQITAPSFLKFCCVLNLNSSCYKLSTSRLPPFSVEVK